MDDLLIIGNNIEEIERLKKSLSLEFKMSDMGLARIYLGAKIRRLHNGILLTKSAYIQKLLERFGLARCNPSLLPMDPHLQLHKNMDTNLVDPEMYRSLVGSLIYLTNTRLDVSFAVGCVARYMV